MTFPSTARRMQRFRQPQKIQGPLFPIEDSELIDAINDYKNIPNNDTDNNRDYKPHTSFDEYDVEIIEVNDVYLDNNNYNENETFNEKDDKENVSTNIQKETEKTVNMYCKS